jgi:hypothetical protein
MRTKRLLLKQEIPETLEFAATVNYQLSTVNCLAESLFLCEIVDS